MAAQAPNAAAPPQPLANLVLVDGVAEQEDPNTHGLSLVTDLKKEDFKLYDQRKEVAIQSLSAGAGTRPIALWLIVQCNDGSPADFGSNFIKPILQDLKTPLQHLAQRDVLGVAHWCADGSAKVDMAPGTDVDAALSAVDQVLGPKVANTSDRAAMQAMLHMVNMAVESTRNTKPGSGSDQPYMPVFLFLNGDQGGTDSREANTIIEALMESSGMVFGLGEVDMHHDVLEDVGSGQTYNQIHYYCRTTGGQFYSTTQTNLFAPTLDYIISQLHARYTLAFQPAKIDGKPHELRVDLNKEAQSRFPKTTPRFRIECIPRPAKP
jgi:hypothetical protein